MTIYKLMSADRWLRWCVLTGFETYFSENCDMFETGDFYYMFIGYLHSMRYSGVITIDDYDKLIDEYLRLRSLFYNCKRKY